MDYSLERGRDSFNTMTWEKKRSAEGIPTGKEHITVRQLFIKNFEDFRYLKVTFIKIS